MSLPLTKISASLEDGLLSFPITDLDKEGKFNPETYAARLEWFVTQNVSAVFVAGGTGEFFSLSENEYKKIVAVTKTITLDDYLVCFEKDSLGTNVPCEKTIISENHKLFYKPFYLYFQWIVER